MRMLHISSSLAAVSLCIGYLAYAQPMCRDLKAPFQYAEASYCPEYNGFGCCGKRDERRAGKAATVAQLKLETDEKREICSDYSRNVSCLTCSPLAGRIFDSSNASNDRIPLCRGYCVETYVKCRFSLLRMFKLHPWRQGLVSKFPKSDEELESDAVTFCERYASDPPYCYPEVAAKERELTAPPEQTDCVCVTPVATGLLQPLAMVDPADKSDRLFIVEQVGLVKILDTTTNVILKEPFLNITSVVMVNVERNDNGLYNLIFHPDFKTNGRLYVFYLEPLNVTNINTGQVGLFSLRLSEFLVDKNNSNQVDYTSQRLIFSTQYEKLLPHSFHLHGGALFFKDGYLYLGVGTGEDPGPLEAQNLISFFGKLLRLDVDGREPGKEYAIPQDNPFSNDPNALPEIYAYGIRMPWRCSVDTGDPETGAEAGRVFCPDVGSDVVEEVNIIEKGGNYGFRVFEGEVCLVDNQTCNEARTDNILPIDSYAYGSEGIAVIGGYVYRGCLYPNLNGLYIYGDFTGGLLVLKENRTSGEWERRRLCVGDSEVCPGADSLPTFVQAFGQDDGGEIYVLATNIPSLSPNVPATGAIYQITDPARRTDPQTCKQSQMFAPMSDPEGSSDGTDA